MSDVDAQPVLGGMVVSRPRPLMLKAPGSAGFRLMSDLHVGAPQTDYALIKREIAEAVEFGDRLLVNGDVLDAIVAADKKRYSPDGIHPRLGGRRDTINGAIEWAAELLAPAAHVLDMIGTGNHEESITRHGGFDPLAALVYELQKVARKRDRGHVVHYGGYCGFVDYRFREQPEPRSHSNRLVIFYHHGSGGASPVTKGMIDFNRKDTWVTADVIWMGHKHNRWNGSVQKIACPLAGDRVKTVEVRHVMTGAYLKTYTAQSQKSMRRHGRRSNYAADMGLSPQGMGGARLTFRLDSDGRRFMQVAQ